MKNKQKGTKKKLSHVFDLHKPFQLDDEQKKHFHVVDLVEIAEQTDSNAAFYEQIKDRLSRLLQIYSEFVFSFFLFVFLLFSDFLRFSGRTWSSGSSFILLDHLSGLLIVVTTLTPTA